MRHFIFLFLLLLVEGLECLTKLRKELEETYQDELQQTVVKTVTWRVSSNEQQLLKTEALKIQMFTKNLQILLRVWHASCPCKQGAADLRVTALPPISYVCVCVFGVWFGVVGLSV